jgi:hypothetical protein
VPGETAINGINIKTMWDITMVVKNTHSLSDATNVRMMNNYHWAAMTYLAWSDYGVCNDSSNVSCIEPYQGSSGATTGQAGSGPNSPGDNPWYSVNGLRSTSVGMGKESGGATPVATQHSNSIYGVYGLNGTMWEYVVSNYASSATQAVVGSSGLTASGLGYTNFTGNAADSGSYATFFPPVEGSGFDDVNKCTFAARDYCLAQGLSEVAGWNSDYTGFVSSSYPWFLRGGSGDNGAGAGVFAFSRDTGGEHYLLGWRLLQSRL